MGWSDLIGSQLGQYTITDELGRGGSSRVYRSFDREWKREVAIKVIPNDAEDRIGFIRRFEREVQAVAQLDHSNIVKVFDRGETDELVYLVMQCVTGGTLRQRCGHPMPVADAAVSLVQMCLALHEAHLHGIIHRDVKPSNMLVDATDPQYLLLTDFGIAKLLGMRGLTKSGTTIGTPEYMSPEQAEGKDIDPRADVYSLGCVLYETLAGRPPFVGSTAVSVLYQQVHSRPSYLRAFNSDVPREVGRIVEQALAKRPEDRFGTAAAMAEALYPYTEGRLPPLPTLDTRLPTISGTGPLLRDSAVSGPLSASSIPSIAPIASLRSSTNTGPLVPSDTRWQPPETIQGGSELVAPAPESWHGLGAEGLDAIFPEDAEAANEPHALSGKTDATGAPEATGTLENTPAIRPLPPVVSGPLENKRVVNNSIPLPAFKLPSKVTQPLNLPLTENGRLDIEALMAQVEEQRESLLAASANAPIAAVDTVDVIRSLPTAPIDPFEAMPPAKKFTSWDDEPGYEEATTDELAALAEPVTPRQAVLQASKAANSTGKPRGVWRPPLEESSAATTPAPQSRTQKAFSVARGSITLPQNRRYLLSGAAVAAVLLVSFLVWASVSASALIFNNYPHTTPVVHRATATATVLPSPTVAPTKGPAPTATVNQQQLLNNEAAGSFRSVILSQFADNSCSPGNQTTHFGHQTVYVDLCTSSNPYSGPATVQIRQGGVIVSTLVQSLYLSPGSSWFFYRYGLATGTYDLLVTMNINGQTAVARDIVFTIG